MSSNKRKYDRSPIEMAASFGIPDDSPAASEVRLNNMSAGGFSFTSEEKMKIGTVVDLNFSVGDDEEITLPVKVAWVKEEDGQFQIGVEILKRKGADYDKFLAFYEQES